MNNRQQLPYSPRFGRKRLLEEPSLAGWAFYVRKALFVYKALRAIINNPGACTTIEGYASGRSFESLGRIMAPFAKNKLLKASTVGATKRRKSAELSSK